MAAAYDPLRRNSSQNTRQQNNKAAASTSVRGTLRIAKLNKGDCRNPTLAAKHTKAAPTESAIPHQNTRREIFPGERQLSPPNTSNAGSKYPESNSTRTSADFSGVQVGPTRKETVAVSRKTANAVQAHAHQRKN